MRVVDATGAQIGQVTAIQVGDPNAVTVQPPPTGAGQALAGAVEVIEVTGPEVPADAAARLLRSGYLRIEGAGAHYATADQIADVAGDVVLLKVRSNQLTTER